MDGPAYGGAHLQFRSRENRPTRKAGATFDIVVDKSTVGRLEELCSTITDTCGLIEATLQLAAEGESEKRAAYIRAALQLSVRGTRSIKLFLSEWSVLVEDSESRANHGLSAKDHTREEADLALILNCKPTTEPQPSADLERLAIVKALQQAGGDKLTAARILGIGKTTLYCKLKEYNLTSPLEIPEREIIVNISQR